jgi:hypothetical protein
MSSAGLADQLSTVSGGNLSITFTLGAYLDCFRVGDGSFMRTVVLDIVLDQTLAFFPSVGLADRS